jgi:hypothetical protein
MRKFFPVTVSFQFHFNTYFFTSVSVGFYFRSFQPKFYDFIKFRVSERAFGFFTVKSFLNFAGLMFPDSFFNPHNFTSQFYEFSLQESKYYEEAIYHSNQLNKNLFNWFEYFTFIPEFYEEDVELDIKFPFTTILVDSDYYSNEFYLPEFQKFTSNVISFSHRFKTDSKFAYRLSSSFSKHYHVLFPTTFTKPHTFPNVYKDRFFFYEFNIPVVPFQILSTFSIFSWPLFFSNFDEDFFRFPKSFYPIDGLGDIEVDYCKFFRSRRGIYHVEIKRRSYNLQRASTRFIFRKFKRRRKIKFIFKRIVKIIKVFKRRNAKYFLLPFKNFYIPTFHKLRLSTYAYSTLLYFKNASTRFF